MNDLPQPKVLGTGLIALDLVVSADPHKPIQAWAGGTCGNVLAILAYLGWSAYPIARLDYDAAAVRVAADLGRWGVNLDFLHLGPQTATPIIVQQNRVSRAGTPEHTFTWSCPSCGHWLPAFRPITRDVIDSVEPEVEGTAVFFLDRLSRAALTLAEQASCAGALVVFEPSGRSDPRLFNEAINLAHVVKYADHRLREAVGAMSATGTTLLEIQTLGSAGLRFRHSTQGPDSKWQELAAVDADRLVDACGSGDWFTGGLLAKLGTSGRERFMRYTTDELIEALNYAQELAAWNCGFEGARGGMYTSFDDQVDFASWASSGPSPHEETLAISCPACPTPAVTQELGKLSA